MLGAEATLWSAKTKESVVELSGQISDLECCSLGKGLRVKGLHLHRATGKQ